MTIPHIAAAIDLGSNTFRLLVAERLEEDFRVLAKRTASVRLGRGLVHSGILDEDSMEKGFGVLCTFREALDHYKPRSIRICGTEALRRAGNSGLFLRRAAKIMQHPIDIINGEEEARLCLAGALAGFLTPLSGPLLLVDVGGGSTELVAVQFPAGEVRTASVGLGVVGLTEKFLAPSPPDVDGLDNHLAATLTAVLEDLELRRETPPCLITGCGGTATSMAALDLEMNVYDAARVHGHVLQHGAIRALWEKMIVLSPGRRNLLPCLGDGRGEILPAGIRTYQVLLRILHLDRLRVSDTGLLEGILLSCSNAAAFRTFRPGIPARKI